MSAAIPLISLHNVTVTYDRHPAVHHVSGQFAKASLTAVVGPNGAGKSSLLKTLVGVIAPSEGTVTWHGTSPREIAYLPQMTAIDERFPMSVMDVVLMGHWRRAGAFREMTAAMCDAALAALSTVGLDGFADRGFGSLSAGQRQRALFARLVVADCPVILLDEPFSAIDSRTTDDLLKLIHQWHREGRTVIAVLHDLPQVRQHFPNTLLLARRLVAWGATAQALTAESLRAARDMSEAWDESAAICRGAA
jgi:zinc/manganese transport system ATP-binding protein